MQHGCLDSTEAEVVAALEPGSRQATGIFNTSGCVFYSRTSRIAQPQKPCYLVKGFAGRVIARSTQLLIYAVTSHENEVGMPSGNDETQEWEIRLAHLSVFREPVRINMSFEMIDPDERAIVRECKRLGKIYTHQKRSGEPRPVGHSNCRNIFELCVCFSERLFQNR